MKRLHTLMQWSLALLVPLACASVLSCASAHQSTAAEPASALAEGVLQSIAMDHDVEALAVDPHGGRVYVAVRGLQPSQAGTLQIYDSKNGSLVHAVPIEAGPVLLSAAGRGGLFVVGNSTLTLFDASGALVRTTSLPGTALSATPGAATAGAVDARSDRFFLVRGDMVRSYDAVTGAPVGVLSLGYVATAAAFDPQTAHLLVAGRQLPAPDHVLGNGLCTRAASCPEWESVIDGQTGQVLASTTLPAADAQPANAAPAHACAIAVAPALHRALVVRAPEGTAVPSALIVDTRTGAVLASAAVGTTGCAVRVDNRSGQAFVLQGPAGQGMHAPGGALEVDLLSGAMRRTILPLLAPTTIAGGGVNQHVFLAGSGAAGGGTISVIDGRSGAVLRDIATAAPPSLLAVDDATARLVAVIPAAPAQHGGVLLLVDAGVGAPAGTIAVGRNPSALAVDEQTHRAFVLDAGSAGPSTASAGPASVSVIDTRRGAVLRTVQVGTNPLAIGVDPGAGRVLVLYGGSPQAQSGATPTPAGLTLLDAASGALLASISLPVPLAGPLVVDARDHLAVLYAPAVPAPPSYGLSFRLLVLQTTSGHLLATSPSIPGMSAALAVDSARGVIYAARTDCAQTCRNGIAVIDLHTARLRVVLPLGMGSIQQMAAVGPTVLALFGGLPGSADQGVVASFDPLRGTLRQAYSVNTAPSGFTLDPATSRLYITAFVPGVFGPTPGGPSVVAAFDTLSNTRVFSTTVGFGTVQPALAPDSKHLFVLNYLDNSVSMLDSGSGRLLATAAVGAHQVQFFPAVTPPTTPLLVVDRADNEVLVVNQLGDSVSILNASTGRPATFAGLPPLTPAARP